MTLSHSVAMLSAARADVLSTRHLKGMIQGYHKRDAAITMSVLMPCQRSRPSANDELLKYSALDSPLFPSCSER